MTLPKIQPCADCVDAVDREHPDVPMGDKQEAERYRLYQSQHLLHMFRETHGRDATSMEELNEWGRQAMRAKERDDQM